MDTAASLANVQSCRGGLPGGQRVEEWAGVVDDAESERVRLASMYAVRIEEERSNRAAGNGEGDWLGL